MTTTIAVAAYLLIIAGVVMILRAVLGIWKLIRRRDL